MRSCSTVGCDQPYCARGLCKSCYSKAATAGKLRALQRDTSCPVSGCDKPCRTQGYCRAHWHAWKRYGDPLARRNCPKGHSRNQHGYVMAPGTKGKLMHRIVMSEHIGRELYDHETVHHKNGFRDDNRIENLELWSSRQPRGQRIEDKLMWAREIESLYGGMVAASDKPDHTTLSIGIAEGEPPTEFKIFSMPVVDTSKGQFTFGPEEAAAVLADFKAQGNSGMLDYDHAALSPMPVDPALAGRAAGWFDIEMRADGLYAINVRWTPPAAEALRRREWRYMSPAFRTKGKRITSLINVALTNLPATRNLQPLMAANGAASDSLGVKIRTALDLPADAAEGDVYNRIKAITFALQSRG